MDIQIGAQYTATTTVDHTNIASAVGSGLVDVFATPMMIALLELAAATCIQGYLEEGQASVGTHVNVSHSGATPVGMTVYATATVTAADRRQVEFQVEMRDDAGPIGTGTHTRFVIDTHRFMEKVKAKSNTI